MEGAPSAGWHPDPANPASGAQRYWDGNQWTDQVRPAPAAPPSYPPPPPPGSGSANHPTFGGQPPYGQQPPYGGPPPYDPWGNGPSQGSLMQQNQRSVTAIGFAVAYIAIALATSFVFLGIVPVLQTVRAFQRKERLAPVAAVFAALVIIVTFVRLGHH